jgi:sugar lactone lactonase YvrE
MIGSLCSERPFVCPRSYSGVFKVWMKTWIAGLLFLFPLLVTTASAQTTTISGTVYMPNGTNVLPNALVYVTTSTPAALVSGANCPGVNCLTASTAVPSGVTIYTYTAVDGTFTLSNVSQSTTYTLVIQAGHWRRQFGEEVGTSAITGLSLSMPSTHAQGDIPLIAIATGSKDAVECVFHDLGVNNNEVTDDTVASGATFGGRIHLYKGDHSAGAEISASTPAETALMGGTSTTPLNGYDMVMFPCQGSTTAESAAGIDNLLAYTSAGGRAFVTHDSRVWLNTSTSYESASFSGVANWLASPVSTLNPDPGVATVNTSFTDGATLAQWLYHGGYADGNTAGDPNTGTLGQVEISTLRWDLSGINAPTQSWLTLNDDVTTSSNPVMQFSFNTPFGAAADAQYGRVLFNEYHVENVTESGNPIFPAECPTLTTAEIAQEKMLEYALFDLSNFVTPIVLPTVSIAITTNPSDSIFMEGDTDDTITVGVTDTSETLALSSATVLNVTLPAGLIATAMTDTDGGWICTAGTQTCTRTTPLAAGASDSVVITVSVAANATGGDPSTTSPVSAVVSNPTFSSSVTTPLTLTLQQHAAVTWATPAAIADGTPLSSTQLNAVGNTAGTYVYSPVAGTVLSPGSHTLSVTFTPTNQDTYPGTGTASVTLVVNGPVAATASAPAATNFGPIPVGTASSSESITFTFLTAGVIGSPVVVTQGATGLDFADATTGTCDTNGTGYVYSAAATCTVNVILTPRYPGTRYGAVLLEDGSGNVLATAYIYGTGTGPQVAFNPGLQSTVASGLMNPDGVAVDGSGNVYIADDNNNRVLKETLSAGTYTQSVLVSVSNPAGVAVDGNGDVYIADSGDSLVLKETPSGGSYAQTTVGTGLLSADGVAVDGRGNIYIADSGNNRVLLETLSAGTYTQTPIGSGFSNPESVAVDGSGNVYVADSGNNRIVEETLTRSGYTQAPLFTGLNDPLGVAVDGVGNVYIADTPSGQILKETLSGESYTQTTLTSGLSLPQTMVVDGGGNVFITDSNNNQVVEENFASPPSLSFASTNVGSTSSDSPKAVTVENIGNAVLIFTASGLVAPADFSQVAGSGSPADCVDGGSVAAGASCDLSIRFAPTTAAVLSESFTLADNALNASPATQTIALSGTGVSSITISPSGATLAAGTVGVAYTAVTFTASGGTAPYTYSHSGTLPPGLALSSSGVLSGTPNTAGGPYSFTVVATDSESVTGSRAYSVTVQLGTATVTLSSLAQTYNGSPLAATATTNPAELTVGFTYTGTNGTTYGPSSTPPTGAGSYTVVATVTSANSSGTATGTLVIAKAAATVTLANLAQTYTGSPLTATAASSPTGLTVGLTYTGTNGTMYGPSSTPPTSVGSYTVAGTVSNPNYAGTASGTMVISQLTSATSLSSSANPVLAQTALTFTATVSAVPGTPIGAVSFLDGTTPIGQGSLTGHVATLITSSLAVGSHAITAVYSGDTNFAGSTSSPLTQSILDFSLAPTSGTSGSGGAPVTTQTAVPGGIATYPLMIVPTAGISFPAPVVLTIAGMPPGATAVITPSTWTQVTSTSWSFPAQTPLGALSLAIQLPSSPVAHLEPGSRPDRKVPAMVLAILLLPFAGRLRSLRKRLWGTISLLLLLAAGMGAMATLSGCGATSGLFADQQKTYTVTVTATSGTLSHSTALTLTVK